MVTAVVNRYREAFEGLRAPDPGLPGFRATKLRRYFELFVAPLEGQQEKGMPLRDAGQRASEFERGERERGPGVSERPGQTLTGDSSAGHSGRVVVCDGGRVGHGVDAAFGARGQPARGEVRRGAKAHEVDVGAAVASVHPRLEGFFDSIPTYGLVGIFQSCNFHREHGCIYTRRSGEEMGIARPSSTRRPSLGPRQSERNAVVRLSRRRWLPRPRSGRVGSHQRAS